MFKKKKKKTGTGVFKAVSSPHQHSSIDTNPTPKQFFGSSVVKDEIVATSNFSLENLGNSVPDFTVTFRAPVDKNWQDSFVFEKDIGFKMCQKFGDCLIDRYSLPEEATKKRGSNTFETGLVGHTIAVVEGRFQNSRGVVIYCDDNNVNVRLDDGTVLKTTVRKIQRVS
ncbi:hypothetical protein PCE1_001280 [Barthelona sp. PCE]